MAKKKYEVITTSLTVHGKGFGEVVELDEKVGERYVKNRYVKEAKADKPKETKKKDTKK